MTRIGMEVDGQEAVCTEAAHGRRKVLGGVQSSDERCRRRDILKKGKENSCTGL